MDIWIGSKLTTCVCYVFLYSKPNPCLHELSFNQSNRLVSHQGFLKLQSCYGFLHSSRQVFFFQMRFALTCFSCESGETPFFLPIKWTSVMSDLESMEKIEAPPDHKDYHLKSFLCHLDRVCGLWLSLILVSHLVPVISLSQCPPNPNNEVILWCVPLIWPNYTTDYR